MPTHVITDDNTGRIRGGGNAGAQGGVFGDYSNGDYAEFEGDGSLIFHGDSTTFRDEFGPLIGSKLESPSSDVVTNNAEGTVDYKTSATLSDYITLPVQINHDVAAQSAVYPHIHWWQTSANIPNWLIQYRWQVNGTAKTTSWTSVKWASHAFTYVSGTFNQITAFGSISPPQNTGVSAILQLRLIRDTANASTLFTGSDPLSATVSALFYDVHVEVDSIGSRAQYAK